MKERILEIINRKDLKDKEKIALIKYFIETNGKNFIIARL